MPPLIEDGSGTAKGVAHRALPPVLRLGFRPFFWLAALFAAIAIPFWAAEYAGALAGLPTPLPAYAWHAHEMVFGFALAVVVGFLFTASRNWTGLDTPTGNHLAALALLWVAARVAALVAPLAIAAVCSCGFIVWAGICIARVLMRAQSRRNYFAPALLFAFAGLDALFFVSAAGLVPISPLVPVRLAVLLIVFLVTVIGGRVIPRFTRNATGVVIAPQPLLDRLALAALLVAIALQNAPAPTMLVSMLWFSAALLHGARLIAWHPISAIRQPILWILHLSYAWIPIGLCLYGFAALGMVSPIIALHALTIGAIGGMIIGMMTRVARGHTGRPLRSGIVEIAAYVLLQLGALIRVGTPLVLPQYYRESVLGSALLWSLAFIGYLAVFTPILWSRRVDGAPG
jgi:uncharacterized protein involved in response to NO